MCRFRRYIIHRVHMTHCINVASYVTFPDSFLTLRYSPALIIRTSFIQNLDYSNGQIACFNDIHCNFGVRHLEHGVRPLKHLL